MLLFTEEEAINDSMGTNRSTLPSGMSAKAILLLPPARNAVDEETEKVDGDPQSLGASLRDRFKLTQVHKDTLEMFMRQHYED